MVIGGIGVVVVMGGIKVVISGIGVSKIKNNETPHTTCVYIQKKIHKKFCNHRVPYVHFFKQLSSIVHGLTKAPYKNSQNHYLFCNSVVSDSYTKSNSTRRTLIHFTLTRKITSYH